MMVLMGIEAGFGKGEGSSPLSLKCIAFYSSDGGHDTEGMV